jgi:hypothetical protein
MPWIDLCVEKSRPRLAALDPSELDGSPGSGWSGPVVLETLEVLVAESDHNRSFAFIKLLVGTMSFRSISRTMRGFLGYRLSFRLSSRQMTQRRTKKKNTVKTNDFLCSNNSIQILLFRVKRKIMYFSIYPNN